MKKMIKSLSGLLLGVLAINVAWAQPDNSETHAIEEKIQKEFHSETVQVVKTDFPNLYEVNADGNLFYTNKDATYLLVGNLIDPKSRKDLTGSYLLKANAIPFDKLPFQYAFKRVRGKGERRMAIFEDPNCRYCHMLHKELQKVDNVTIYTFMLPILSRQSIEISKAVWCSQDPAQAWDSWMESRIKPQSPSKDCKDVAIDHVLKLADKMSVQATPTLFFANGKRVGGYIDAQEIEANLVSK